MASEPTYDAVVVGAGAGGLTVAIGLAGFGRRVALVEAGRVGGDCTNVGCVPSKRLIHLARRGGADPAAMLADVRATRDGLARRERAELVEHPRIDLVEGRGTLVERGVVLVSGPGGDRTLRARDVVLATGSRPRRIGIPGLPPERLHTNETIFEIEGPPEHLAIVGAGAVGVELAGAFRRMGSRVTLVDVAERVLASTITEASEAVHAALVAAGIDVRLSSSVERFDHADSALTISRGGEMERISGVDAVLSAVGRAPALDGLGLEAAGVATSREGIVVDGWGRTSVRGVWAVGDVTAGSNQTHAANAIGRRVVQRIAFRRLPPIGKAPVIPSAVFCEPEVASVGLSPAELVARCNPDVVRRVRVDLADTDRGLTDGVTSGFVVIDAVRLTGRIISATVVGPAAGELIAVLTLAIARGTTLYRLSRLVYAYPTFAGAIGKAADTFARETGADIRGEAAAYVRYRVGRRKRRA